jgi:hypothetical protein
MQQLTAGKLPLKTLQLFFRNWGAYTIEINTLTACTYHRNITFLKVRFFSGLDLLFHQLLLVCFC